MPQLAAAAIAYALPATAATAVTIGTTAVTYATIASYALVIGGSVAYSSSQNARARRAMNSASMDNGRSVMVRDPVAPRRLIYGTMRVSGSMPFAHTTGTKNEYLHFIVVLAGHEVEDIGEVMFNDEVLDLNGGTTPLGKYAGYVRINKHLGATTQTADADLVSEIPSLWTANHRLRGCAYLAVRIKWSPEIFPNGLPTVSAVVRGKKVYDPRTSTTVWSNNSALCAADFMTDSTFGKGIAYARISNADLIEAANICDEAVVITTSLSKTCDVTSGNRHIGCASVGDIVPGFKVSGTGIVAGSTVVSVDSGGTFFTIDRDPTATNTGITLTVGDTEQRYTTNGIVTADQDPDEVLRDLTGAMAGHIAEPGGIWTIRAGAWRTPTVTLLDSDLAGSFSVQPRQSRQDTFNGVKGVFISPANQWAPADFPAVKNDTYMANDGAVRLWLDVQYNFTTSPATAQRLAKIELERGRQQITCSGLYMLKAMQLMPGDVVGITRSRLGWATKYFEVIDWSFQHYGDPSAPAIGIALNLRETAEAVWDWANGEETATDLAPNTDLPDPFTVPTPATPTATSDALVQSDGTVLARINLAWTTPNNTYVEQGGHVAIEFKEQADSVWMEWGRVDGSLLADTITGLVIGTTYDFRIRFINSMGVRGAYSATDSEIAAGDITAPSTPTGLAAVAGTGKSISLSWDEGTAADLSEYRIYRHTADVVGSAVLIAEVAASRFVDVDVAYSTQYFYWASAVDTSDNESAKTLSVNATTAAMPAGIDTTPPSDPAAATLNTSGTYQATDGGTRAFLTINVPAMPTGGVVLNLLYRKNTSTGWLIADQRSTGGSTTRIDDLSPGVSYEVAAQAFSAYGYGSGIVAATSSPFTAPSDTTGPSTPTGLAAVTGTGKSVSLDWNDNTESDFSEYGVYRSTDNVTYAKIAETRASRFVDVDVTIGTLYYYKVSAYDRSENQSAQSSAVSATPGQISASVTDTTAPSNPTAASLSASGTYDAGDGTVFSYLTISVPGLPALAKYQNLLYKKTSGGGDWLIAAQLTNSGTQSVKLDDLTPGVSYDVAVVAYSAFAISSSVVAATSSPFTAPNKTSAPSNISGGTLSASGVVPKFYLATTIHLFGCCVSWTPSSDKDFAYYEVKGVGTLGDSNTDYTWIQYDGGSSLMRCTEPRIIIYNLSLSAGYVYVRQVNTSGVAGAWAYLGNANANASIGVGNAAAKDVGTGSSNVAAGNDSRFTDARQCNNTFSNAATSRTALGVGTGDTPSFAGVQVSGTQVIGARKAAISAITGGSDNESATTGDFTGADTVNLAALVSHINIIVSRTNNHANRLAEIRDRMKATGGHGLISD